MMGGNTAPNGYVSSSTSETAGIVASLQTLLEPGQVVEVRILNTSRNTVSGYFNDLSKLAAAAAWWNRKATVYFTLNQVNPALLARANNRLIEYAKQTTSDPDIERRRWLLIDCDPVRPAGISSTDEEHAAALSRARIILLWLSDLGFQSLVLGDSGNGAHVLVRIDLPNDAASLALAKRCLEAVALQFSDDMVTVDLSVFNAARICKLYGTVACKGDSTFDRPHRLARLLEVPEVLTPEPRLLLEQLAALAPEEPRTEERARGNYGHFNLDEWIARHHLDVRGPYPWGAAGRKWIFPVCPWDSAHTNQSAYLLQLHSSALSAGCHHNGCAGKRWQDLRDVIEPGFRSKQEKNSSNGRGYHQTSEQADDRSRQAEATEDEAKKEPPPAEPWPELGEDALYGLAGDVVKVIDPHTEADKVAVLVTLLTMFGNCVNANAHFLVEYTKHFVRLFVALVGFTAKGRKGQSLSTLRYIFELIDRDWSKERVVLGGLSSGEGLIDAVRDERRNEEGDIIDKGEPDKRILLIEEELVSALKVASREGNTLSAILRQAWDRGNLRPLTKNNKIRATGAHISIVAHITQDELLRYLTATEQSNGYANRFIWLLVKRSKIIPRPVPVPHERLDPLVERLSLAVNDARKTGTLDRDEEAEAF